jgi:transcriptional regulator with XRE-family HTH domain
MHSTMLDCRRVGKKKLGPISKTLANRVKDLRVARGLTQAQLAGDDFSKGFISLVESGRSRMSFKSAEIFAERLQVPVTALLDQREQLKLTGAREALERAMELCDEMEKYAQSRRALIAAAIDQFNAWNDMQRKLVEATVAGVKADAAAGRTPRAARSRADRSAPADARG